MAFGFDYVHDGMEEYDDNARKFLCEMLPYVGAQVRIPLDDMYHAARDVAPDEKRDEDPELDELMSSYNRAWYRMLRLANQLELATILNRKDPLPRKNVDIIEWLDDIILEAKAMFAVRGIELVFKTDMQSHQVAINPEYLHRAMWQLLSNALKAYPEVRHNGTVTVSVQKNRQQVLISVADDGCGISAERMDWIFKLYTIHGHMPMEEDGVGLGLPTTRHIAELHGGRLMLSSTEDKGTTVTVALPDKCTNEPFRESIFIYGSGFPVVLIELADGLPNEAYLQRYLDF